ncbi:TPR repeat protein [Candidatus Moduliflexus flocculans]|uniref:TPR repeat protein n=1 Tax=Candidatus Moduliflexus flocculans TaxID=1499966 RepID=A0A081BLQ6_9BACT|nr:TPR repeat protein [Candidatus Moduliflexus flocculans]
MVYLLGLIGSIYQTKGNYDTALQWFQQGNAVARESKKDALIVSALIFEGLLYQEWSRYEEAIAAYEEALPIAMRMKADIAWKDVLIGSAMLPFGAFLEVMDMHDTSDAVYQSSFQTLQRIPANALFQKRISEGYLRSSIGAVYAAWGKYDEAVEANTLAIAYFQRTSEIWGVGMGYQQLGSVYLAWGRYDDARGYFEQAIWAFRRANDQLYVSSAFHSLGEAYQKMGQFDNALGALQQALHIAQTSGQESDMAASLNKIGQLYREQGQYDEALTSIEQALELDKKAGREAAIATDLQNLGEVYRLRGEHDRAIAAFEDALQRNRDLKRLPDIANNLTSIGNIAHGEQRYADAIPFLEEAVTIKEQLRQTASSDIRRDYFASQITAYCLLISCYINIKDFPNAFRIMELSRAKTLEERLSGAKSVAAAQLAGVQANLPEQTAILMYAETGERTLARLLITKTAVSGVEDDVECALSAALDANASINNVAGETAVSGEKRGLNLDDESTETASPEKPEPIYRDLESAIREYRGMLTGSIDEQQAFDRLSNSIYRLLFDGFDVALQGKTRLMILPDGMLNFLPFETLRDDKGRYLVESFLMTYAQSVGVSEALAQRRYREERKPLLAFGGAVYEAGSYREEMRDAIINLTSLRAQVDDALRRGASLRSLYRQAGRGSWINLPGTLTEVNAIASVTPDAELVTGADVNETKIKELAASTTLQQYRVLHFATHGDANPEIPELSALVLSQADDEKNDGYLSAGEIVRLNFAADFVNLSACETGLGKLYSGEGVVGLTQAFLLAGANGLSVSLWSVADESTAQFMTALYQIAHERGIGFAEASSEIKRRFIRGDFGAEWTHPYFWAPFVYYGK